MTRIKEVFDIDKFCQNALPPDVLLNLNTWNAEIGDEIIQKVRETAQGMHTKSESILHQEFIMTDKSLSPIGSASLPILQSHLNLSVT